MLRCVLYFYQKGMKCCKIWFWFSCRQIWDRFDIRVVWSQREHFRAQFGTTITPPPPSLSLSLYLMSGRGRGIPELFLASSIRTPPPPDQPCPPLCWLGRHEIRVKNKSEQPDMYFRLHGMKDMLIGSQPNQWKPESGPTWRNFQ